VANSGSNNISVLPGNGDGTFGSALTQPAGSSPRSLIESDLNADGIPDLVVANFSSNDLWILLGNGDGTFRRDATYATGNAPRAVLAARLTQSGHTDLAVANSASNSVSVFLGAGLGRFADGVQYPTGSGPVALASADFNSDGIPDLFTVNAADNTVSLLPGFGGGTFQTAIAIPVGSRPVAVAQGDFNRDGLTDGVIANSNSNDFSILLGAGTGSFHDPGGTFFSSSGGLAYTPPPAFTYQDLGLNVKITPHVNGTDAITLDLESEVQLLTGQAVNGLPVLSHRKLNTQVRLQTGEWAILGGLLSDTEARSLAGISGLANLPGIGVLLRKNTKDRDTTQVLVLIKANLDSLPASAFETHAIPIGTETRPVAP